MVRFSISTRCLDQATTATARRPAGPSDLEGAYSEDAAGTLLHQAGTAAGEGPHCVGGEACLGTAEGPVLVFEAGDRRPAHRHRAGQLAGGGEPDQVSA